MSRHSISDSAAAKRGQLVLVACLQPGADDMHPASVKRCWPSSQLEAPERCSSSTGAPSLSSGQTGEHRAGRRPAGPGRLAEAGWQGSASTGLDFWLLRDGPGPGRGHLPGTPPGTSARPLGRRRCCCVIVSVRPGSGVCSPSLPGVAGSWSSVAGPVRRAGWPGPLPLAVVRNQPRVADRRHDGRRSDRLDPAPVPDGCCGPADRLGSTEHRLGGTEWRHPRYAGLYQSVFEKINWLLGMCVVAGRSRPTKRFSAPL